MRKKMVSDCQIKYFGRFKMNAVGIDVSKEKSMIAVMQPFGEVVFSPFEVKHTKSDLTKLVHLLKGLNGDTTVVMEATGNYHTSIARFLYDSGIRISVVNALLIHNYGNNSLRKAKTDKKDAIKLANYAIEHWNTLPVYTPQNDSRFLLKSCYRQYQQYSKLQTMLKNNLISLLDQSFPGLNSLFSSSQRSDGNEKWIDFAETFWHCECVSNFSEKMFTMRYQKWCINHGYRFNVEKAKAIYNAATEHVSIVPKNNTTKMLIEKAVHQLKANLSAIVVLRNEMQSIASKLPEYPIVMDMYGVGPALGPQLIAEIGDVRRFYSKKALIAFAGIDAPPYQSGSVNVNSRSISKRGSASLRRTLFLVMSSILINSPCDEPVYQYMDKKRTEGKPYLVYMMASANKFLRIYYARVKEVLNSI